MCKKRRLRLFSVFVLMCIAIFGVLSGSRSSLLTFVFGYFGYCFFHCKISPNRKIIRWLFVIAVIGALYIFSFSAAEQGLLETGISFIVRVIANGDIYWLSYPKAVIEDVQSAPWYIDLFSGFIFPLRLANPIDYHAAIGAQAVWINNPGLEGANIGANSRPPIFGYVHFGYWGWLFSLLLGAFISSAMKIVPSLCPKGIIGSIIAFHIYSQLIGLIVDPAVGVAFLFEAMVGIIFLIFIIIMIGFVLNFSNVALKDTHISFH